MTAYTDELSTVAESVSRILTDAPNADVAWEALADNGFASIGTDDSFDIPAGHLLTAIAQETGRALSPAPYLSGAVVGATVISGLDDEVRSELGERLASGEVGVLAVPLSTSAWDPLAGCPVATRRGEHWTVSGSIIGVLNGAQAAYFLVPATNGLLLVEANATGVAVAAVEGADPSRPIADVVFADADARVLASGEIALSAVRRGLTVGLVSLSAELVGAADEFLDQTIAYLKQRWAFGRPIGQFQAVKHTAADLYTEIAHARALLRDAVEEITAKDAASPEVLLSASLAKIQASKALALVAIRGIQLHGAIGFTWELGAHRFMRRSMTDRFLFGDDDLLVRSVANALSTSAAETTQPTAQDAGAVWLAANAPVFVGRRDHVGHFAVLAEDEAADQLRRAREWERLKSESGFAGIAVPKELGGQGKFQFEALTFQAHEHVYDLPHWIFGITFGMIMPTIISWGTEEQKSRYVPPMLNGTGLWCQLFSEPGAGSDLAMASTKATKVDGGWRVQGQKVWNSGADNADFGLLVARTDPDAPKHKGLTVFIVPMDAPGVTVRPIVQASGSTLFSETFLDDVFLPDEAVVGGVANGWRVAITTLMNERLALTGDGVPFQRAFQAARQYDGHLPADLGVQLVDLYSLYRALHSLSEQILEGVRAGVEPGPEGSINKLLTGRAALGVADFVSRLLGPEVLREPDWNEYVIGAVGLLIGGGTEEIQKNVLSERVLGLPPEPRGRSGLSWAEEKAAYGSEATDAR
ncbi:hypothetical protein E5206_14460 [Arthrobacter sp. PAMC25564]|uniref:acyl-CoA dehydrogenase n=1 Tax=Arthrobacter sp. PAMC25564 TaxID=2565366 RepID=UPI0010A21171|nr:acyl-CoA dehydrogenase family protein [Arthrobacter sp. PAMC25564]QCB97966.1 hypothetical protein E5206_14460 [Arthrobacter sp. PAMC25564]